MATATSQPERTTARGSIGFFLKFNAFGLGLLGFWTAIDTTLLPHRVTQTAPAALAGSGVGLISALGVGLAIIIQPIAGRASDAWPHGDRRRPFMLAGIVAVIPSVILFGAAPNYLLLLAGFVLMQFATNIAQAGFQALIPDLVSPSRRGAASAAKNGLSVLGAAIGLVGAQGIRSATGSTALVLAFLGVLIAGTGLLTVFWTPRDEHEGDDDAGSLAEALNLAAMLRSFRATLAEHRTFRLGVAAQFLFLLGAYPAQRFLLLFLRDRFGASASRDASIGGVAAIILAVAGAGIAGGLSDRIGRKDVLIGSVAIGAVGLFAFGFSPSLPVAGIAGGLIAIGLGAFQSVNWALMNDDLPNGQSAAALGVANIATAGAGTAASLFGPLVDGLNAVAPHVAYQTTFALAGLVALLSLIPLRRVSDDRKERNPNAASHTRQRHAA